MEEAAKAAAAHERRSDSELFSKMISKMINNSDEQNQSTDSDESEKKMVTSLFSYRAT